MQIYGPAHLHGAQALGAPHMSRLSASQASSQSAAIQDELQISEAGRLVDQARELPDVRQDLVNRIRSQIAAGTYETPDKMSVALDRLLDEIG
jgi:negative regulator of flagellin synthesis FlgM